MPALPRLSVAEAGLPPHTVVVDASVCLKWFIDEEGVEMARRLLNQHGSGDLSICMPDIAPVEVANALWSQRSRGIAPERAGRYLARLFSLGIPLADSCDALPKAVEIAYATGATVYDALYIATAAGIGCPMVTADSKLVNRVGRDFPFVVLLDDFVDRR